MGIVLPFTRFQIPEISIFFAKTPFLELNVVTCSVLRMRQVNAKSKKLHIADGKFLQFQYMPE